MRGDELNDGWHERGDHDQHEQNNGADDKAALCDPLLKLVPGNQANITQRILTCRSARTDFDGALRIGHALFQYTLLGHGRFPPSQAVSVDGASGSAILPTDSMKMS